MCWFQNKKFRTLSISQLRSTGFPSDSIAEIKHFHVFGLSALYYYYFTHYRVLT